MNILNTYKLNLMYLFSSMRTEKEVDFSKICNMTVLSSTLVELLTWPLFFLCCVIEPSVVSISHV